MENYKEKYEQAIFRMNKWVEGSEIIDPKEVAEFVFPELKESDDERIRKWLIGVIKSNEYGNISNVGEMPCPKPNVIAWLEKQGEILENIKYKEAMLDCQTCANYKNECFPDRNIFKCSYPIKYSEKNPQDIDENQGEQKSILRIDNSQAKVVFPFKAKVKSNGKIVTIHGGQLSPDGKEWIKYQSDKEDGYRVYEPADLESVCNDEQNPAWSKKDERMLDRLRRHFDWGSGYYLNRNDCDEADDWLISLKERIKGE